MVKGRRVPRFKKEKEREVKGERESGQSDIEYLPSSIGGLCVFNLYSYL